MRDRIIILGAILFLSACTVTTADEISSITRDNRSSAQTSSTPTIIEVRPLTTSHFQTMTLSGTNLVIGNVIERNSVYAKHFITYKSNGLLISGTFSIPHGDGPFPLIIQNHGYIDPDIYTNGRGLRREQDAMARAGFAVLHTDYRGHAQSDPNPNKDGPYENALGYALDSLNAILAVRELGDPHIDAEHVGMLGHSMGGGVTMQIASAHPEVVDAIVLYAPVSPDAWTNFSRWNDDQEYAPITLATFGGTKEEAPAAWEAISPLGSLDRITAPILLFQGENDKDVPAEWSDDLDQTLTALSKDIDTISYPNEGHEFSSQWSHFINTTIAFFEEHLR